MRRHTSAVLRCRRNEFDNEMTPRLVRFTCCLQDFSQYTVNLRSTIASLLTGRPSVFFRKGTLGAHPLLKAASLAGLETDTGLMILRSVDSWCRVSHFRAGQSGDAVTPVTLVWDL